MEDVASISEILRPGKSAKEVTTAASQRHKYSEVCGVYCYIMAVN